MFNKNAETEQPTNKIQNAKCVYAVGLSPTVWTNPSNIFSMNRGNPYHPLFLTSSFSRQANWCFFMPVLEHCSKGFCNNYW